MLNWYLSKKKQRSLNPRKIIVDEKEKLDLMRRKKGGERLSKAKKRILSQKRRKKMSRK